MSVQPRLFVSYAHKSKEAEMFIALLTKEVQLHNKTALPSDVKFEVWSDHNLKPGDDWSQAIDSAIDTCFAVLVLLTPEALESHYVTYEWSYAMGRSCEVIPVVLSEIDTTLHAKLGKIQWSPFWEAKEKHNEISKFFYDLRAKYEIIRLRERLNVSKQISQHIIGFLDLGRKQRISGDFNNALASLRSAEDNIKRFNTEYPVDDANLSVADRSEVDTLTDDVFYEIGLIHYQRGDIDVARDYYVNALKRNETHVHSMVGLGALDRMLADEADKLSDIASKKEYLDRAFSHFKTALDLQPDVRDENDEFVWASLGGICKRMGKRKDAIMNYIAASRFKKSAYPYGNLGLLYKEEGNAEKMLANFRVALYFAQARLRLHPEDVWAHNDELVAQMILNYCSPHDGERKSEDEILLMVDRIRIVVEGSALKRLKTVIEIDLLQNPEPVISQALGEEILTRLG